MRIPDIHQPCGFTLIELLVAFAIAAVFTSLSVASFTSYNNTQSFNTSVSNVEFVLNTAKSRSMSGIMPSVCLNQQLNGYQVAVSIPSGFELDVLCGGTAYPVNKYKLPANVTFANGSAGAVIFQPITGTTANQSEIILVGFGRTKTITISPAGIVTVALSSAFALCARTQNHSVRGAA